MRRKTVVDAGACAGACPVCVRQEALALGFGFGFGLTQECCRVPTRCCTSRDRARAQSAETGVVPCCRPAAPTRPTRVGCNFSFSRLVLSLSLCGRTFLLYFKFIFDFWPQKWTHAESREWRVPTPTRTLRNMNLLIWLTLSCCFSLVDVVPRGCPEVAARPQIAKEVTGASSQGVALPDQAHGNSLAERAAAVVAARIVAASCC